MASNSEYPSTSGGRPDRTSKDGSSSILNGVWMRKDSLIESVFFKDLEVFNKGKSCFNDHICLNPSLPGQIRTSEGDTVQLKIDFKQPPDMPIKPDKQRLETSETLLRMEYWHIIYFKPNPDPANLQLGQLCNASYEAEVSTCEGQTTTGGFSDEFQFGWPLTSNQREQNDECRARPGNDCQQIIVPNLPAGGTTNTGRCDEHIDQNQRGPADVVSPHRYNGEASSVQYKNYFTDIVNTLEQTSNQKDFKVHIVGVDGGTPEHGGCKIDVSPGLVEKPTEIEICLGNDPNHSPDSVVPVSHIFKFTPVKFKAPVHVKLISYLFPKPGKQLRVRIMSKTGGAEWKQIQEVILGPGNEIEYTVSQFCWHVAVVSEEDEKDGEYHLLNDIWMHIPTGMMLSLFWKDWFSLTKGSKKLEVDHKRIISLPVEVIASVGDTVAADIECLGHPEMKITSVDGSDGRIEIGSAMRKKTFFAMLFRPDPHLESLKATNRFEVIYRANVINGEGQRTDGGFSVPLHVSPSLLRSIACSAVPAEQERNDDEPSTSYQPDVVKQTHVAEASGLKMIDPNKAPPQEVLPEPPVMMPTTPESASTFASDETQPKEGEVVNVQRPDLDPPRSPGNFPDTTSHCVLTSAQTQPKQVPAEQERNDDQPSTSYQPDAVKQTVAHAAEASGLKMIGPIEVSFESEVRDDHQATMPFQSEIPQKTLQLVRSLSNESEPSQEDMIEKNKDLPSSSYVDGEAKEKSSSEDGSSSAQNENIAEGSKNEATPPSDENQSEVSVPFPVSSINLNDGIFDRANFGPQTNTEHIEANTIEHATITNIHHHYGGGDKTEGDIKHVGPRKIIKAMKMAETGGTIRITEYDTRNTLVVQTPSGNTSAEESPSTSGANGARPDRTLEIEDTKHVGSRNIINAMKMAETGGTIRITEYDTRNTLAVQTPSGNTSAEGNIKHVGFGKKINAMKMVETGGIFTTTEHDTRHTLAVQTPSGDVSAKGGPREGNCDEDMKTKFIDQLKLEVFPALPAEKVVNFVEELQESHGIYSVGDFSFMDRKDLTFKSIHGVQLTRFRKYVQAQQNLQPLESSGHFGHPLPPHHPKSNPKSPGRSTFDSKIQKVSGGDVETQIGHDVYIYRHLQLRKGYHVYKGIRKLLNGRVTNDLAVKIFHIADNDEELFKQYVSEVKKMARFSHSNIVNFFHCDKVWGNNHGEFYIAMELCHEMTLADLDVTLLQREQQRNLFLQICDGVEYLHQTEKVAHMDLKPGNILVTVSRKEEKHKAVVSDFGLSKCVDKKIEKDKTSISRSSSKFGGTQGWIPAEMQRDESKGWNLVEPNYYRADIFSLGLVGHHIFYGCHPFRDDDRPEDTAYWHVNIDKDKCIIGPQESESAELDVTDLFKKMLSHDPLQRPTIEEVLQHWMFWSLTKKITFIKEMYDGYFYYWTFREKMTKNGTEEQKMAYEEPDTSDAKTSASGTHSSQDQVTPKSGSALPTQGSDNGEEEGGGSGRKEKNTKMRKVMSDGQWMNKIEVTKKSKNESEGDAVRFSEKLLENATEEQKLAFEELTNTPDAKTSASGTHSRQDQMSIGISEKPEEGDGPKRKGQIIKMRKVIGDQFIDKIKKTRTKNTKKTKGNKDKNLLKDNCLVNGLRLIRNNIEHALGGSEDRKYEAVQKWVKAFPELWPYLLEILEPAFTAEDLKEYKCRNTHNGDIGVKSLLDIEEIKAEVAQKIKEKLGVAHQDDDLGKCTLFNDVFIQSETAYVLITTCLNQKSSEDIRDIMRSRGYISFSTKTFQICGRSNQKVSLKLDISEPQKMTLKKEFHIQKLLESQSHHIVFAARLQLRGLKGPVKGEFLAMVVDKIEDAAKIEHKC